ncbi:Uma2 family endonuclease [Streptomyces lydicamycinicus]|uniref:Uma2 family endonuclease n=1 Tax=Streptomyces lydicamycinicus TaxID=1546107 RepID=UPI003C2F75B8
MTAMAHEPVPTDEETLLDYFLALDTPTGFRAELIEGEIVVTPPTDGTHEHCFSGVVSQIMRQSAVDMGVSGYKGLEMRRGGRRPKNHVIPDATIAPRALRLFRSAPPWMPSDGVAMVVEVTSSNPERDRKAKRHCYARAGIPLYLLVDRSNAEITLFSDPSGDDYAGHNTAPAGKPLPLPTPFSFDLETADFL